MDNLISGRQLAQAIGVSHQTVFNWTKSGRLPSYSCEDGHRRYDLADGVAAKAKTKPAMKREQGIPDPDPTIVGFCYSDAYGNIRVRFKDIMGKTHDAEVTPAANAEDIALPAEDYYAKPRGYAYVDPAGTAIAVDLDDMGRVRVTEITGTVKLSHHEHGASNPTTGVPNDIAPPPPVAFEFDDDGA